MEKYKVVISEQAKKQLVTHAAFLARVSRPAAERLPAGFRKAAGSLEAMPQRCQWLSGEYLPRCAYRQLVFEKRYMLIFQIKDDTVYIEYVIDCRQDYGWLIDQ